MTQKLSPQQIQFIKLLQVPTVELEARVEEELEANPALEEGLDDEIKPEVDQVEEAQDANEDLNIEDYLQHDDYSGYKMQGDGPGDEEDREKPIASHTSMTDLLNQQLGFLKLDGLPQLLKFLYVDMLLWQQVMSNSLLKTTQVKN